MFGIDIALAMSGQCQGHSDLGNSQKSHFGLKENLVTNRKVSFHCIFMTLGKHVFLNEFYTTFESGSCMGKVKVTVTLEIKKWNLGYCCTMVLLVMN